MGAREFIECPTCGTGMRRDLAESEGVCTSDDDRMDQARRLVDADPVVPPDQYNEVRTENLLTSIAYSLSVIAGAINDEARA